MTKTRANTLAKIMGPVLALMLVCTTVSMIPLAPPALAESSLVVGRLMITEANQGQTLTNLVIAGEGFLGANPSLDFGEGVTVDAFSVDSDTQITCDITVDWDAAVGGREVMVTAGGESGTLSSGRFVGSLDKEPFDLEVGATPSLLALSEEVYAVAYQGVGDDGWIKTFELDQAGEITLLDELEFEKQYCASPNLKAVQGDYYAIAYTGPQDHGWVKTLEITSEGAINGASRALAHWELDETAGSEVPDSSPYGQDGICRQMEDDDWVSAKVGNGLEFDGSNDYVDEIGRAHV